MAHAQQRPLRATGTPTVAERPSTTVHAATMSWDTRIYLGVRVARIAPEVRGALARALGEIGTEAEFFLLLVNTFPTQGRETPAAGEAFVRQLETSVMRLAHAALALEVATQSYLGALETIYPELRERGGEEGEPWWPPFAGYSLPGEPLDLRLRRCGYAYRHVIAAHLAANVDAIAEGLALVLHALSTLPPAGTLPARSLHQGLYELAATIQGDLVPHNIRDLSGEYPGLLTGIQRLRVLHAREESSLASDLAWAHAQYALARTAQSGATGQHAAVGGGATGRQRWAGFAARQWQDVIAALEHLQRTPTTHTVRRR